MADQIPLPRPTSLSAPHWDGCRESELRVQQCRDCSAYIFIPQDACTNCLSDQLEWATSSGRGQVYSYTIVHRPQRLEFEVPYAVAIIELEEGWRMLSNLIDVEMDAIEVGMPVEVTYRVMSDEITLPMFRPRSP